MTYGMKQEELKMFSPKSVDSDRAQHIFKNAGSAGANNEKLARILIAWDFAMNVLHWNISLTDLLTKYQASVGAKYHDDYTKVATTEELDYRLAKRRAGSLLAQQQTQSPTSGGNVNA